MNTKKGNFVISLDFELMWGVRDVVTPKTYGEHIKGVHTALPKILECFTRSGIHATFAAVGLLFFKDKTELMHHLPIQKPNYIDHKISPYGDYLNDEIGFNYADDPYHYGLHLIELIKNTPGQEIATHTFSHYYCLEPGQSIDDFRFDLEAAQNIARKKNLFLETIIFPRNQVNEKYLEVCSEHGISSYRHNEKSWIYNARNTKEESLFRRMVRLLDAYVNISGHHCYSLKDMSASVPFNISSSRFLRPYSKKLKLFENLRLKRITKSMTYAAKNKLTYHLWWHPHNFGINQDENFAFLEKVLAHYRELNKKYSFTSITMKDLSQELYETRKK